MARGETASAPANVPAAASQFIRGILWLELEAVDQHLGDLLDGGDSVVEGVPQNRSHLGLAEDADHRVLRGALGQELREGVDGVVAVDPVLGYLGRGGSAR